MHILVALLALSTAPSDREVDGNTITSSDLPAVRLVVDEGLAYAGGHTFMLSHTTRAEQHFFVDAGDDGVIDRLYWIQFEGKVGGRGYPYDYSGDPVIDIAGKPFHINWGFYPKARFAGPPGSDVNHALDFLAERGFHAGEALTRVRLVWLLGDPPLDELMIIYLEDLAPHGLDVETLTDDDARWQVFKQELQDRALENITITPLPR